MPINFTRENKKLKYNFEKEDLEDVHATYYLNIKLLDLTLDNIFKEVHRIMHEKFEEICKEYNLYDFSYEIYMLHRDNKMRNDFTVEILIYDEKSYLSFKKSNKAYNNSR